MSAIQFETVVNDNVIPIPTKYRSKIRSGSRVKVVTMLSADNETDIKASKRLITVDDFTELKIDTRGFKFNREEANERR